MSIVESGDYHHFATVETSAAKQYSSVTDISKQINIEAKEKILMTVSMYNGESPVFMARIKKVIPDTILNASDVFSIRYTAFKLSTDIYSGTSTKTAVTGHANVNVPLSAVLNSLVVSALWTVDNIGYNFIHEPDCEDDKIFPAPGKYQVVYNIVLNTGNPIVLTYEVEVQ